jgi:hypothetical protein
MRALRRLVRDISVSRDVPVGTPLAFVSAVHQSFVRARRWAYDSGWLTPTKADAPVMSVGDVTLGGSGKSSMSEYIAREIADLGWAPTVLCHRGVGEAAMLRRRLFDVPHAKVLHSKNGAGNLARGALADGLLKNNDTHSQTPFKQRIKGFERDRRFAGDVDVDDVELRCVTEQEEAGASDGGFAGAQMHSSTSTDARRLSSGGGFAEARMNSNTGTSPAFIVHDGSLEFQLHKDLEVVMVHSLLGWGNGRFAPRGPLMQNPDATLGRADVVALHHFPVDDADGASMNTNEKELEFAKRLEREVRGYLPDSPRGSSDAYYSNKKRNVPLVIKTTLRATKIDRLARYVGASPPHEWRLPVTRLRGARVFCPTSVLDADGVTRLLQSLTEPAVGDTKNGYGLRMRDTGSVEVWDFSHRPGFWFDEVTLSEIVTKYKEMHLRSGDVGSAEARLVLTEKDVGAIMASEAEKKYETLAVLSKCDPIVLSTELVVPDATEREALRARVRETLQGWRKENAWDRDGRRAHKHE